MKTSKVLGNQQILLATLRYSRTDHSTATLKKFGYFLANAIELKSIGHDGFVYTPHGETIIIYLAESHIAIETYPEHGIVELEISSCRPFSDTPVFRSVERFGMEILSRTVVHKTQEHKWYTS